VIQMDNTAGLTIGQDVTIGAGTPTAEVNTIAGFGSLILKYPLKFAHAAGTLVGAAPAPTTGKTKCHPMCAPLDKPWAEKCKSAPCRGCDQCKTLTPAEKAAVEKAKAIAEKKKAEEAKAKATAAKAKAKAAKETTTTIAVETTTTIASPVETTTTIAVNAAAAAKKAGESPVVESGACRGSMGGLGSIWRGLELGVLLLGGLVALMPTALCGLRE